MELYCIAVSKYYIIGWDGESIFLCLFNLFGDHTPLLFSFFQIKVGPKGRVTWNLCWIANMLLINYSFKIFKNCKITIKTILLLYKFFIN